ncbi:MAG: NmrA family NAD(P)-binding protein [Pseudomonadales bacterium]|nr:NmrA family NAD(P)-binding protein [Pseudomonadales bacterium]
MMILVIGATGKTGSAVCRLLAEKNIAFKALTRNKDKARKILPANCEIIQGDLSDKSRLYEIIEGVTHIYLATPPEDAMVAYQNCVIDVAAEHGVQRIVKLSGLGPSLKSKARLPRLHAEIEKHLKESGIHYSLLHSNLFMQVLFGDATSIKEDGKIYAPAADGKISFTDINNVAEIAVQCLQDDSNDNQVFKITGAQAESYNNVAVYLSSALNRKVEYQPVSYSQARQSMISAGYDEWLSDALIELYEIYSANDGCYVSDDYKKCTGKPASQLLTFIEEHSQQFA